jgi:phosphoglycerate-specific signal transduction histidine kinase
MKKTFNHKQKGIARWDRIQRRLEHLLKRVEADPMTPAPMQLRDRIEEAFRLMSQQFVPRQLKPYGIRCPRTAHQVVNILDGMPNIDRTKE